MTHALRNRALTTRDVAKFTAFVALLAILADAAVGHAHVIGTTVLVILLALFADIGGARVGQRRST
jgi:hypothetical protein